MSRKKQKETVTQRAYEVVKFAPTHCPNCRNPFTRESWDGYLPYTFWQNDTVESAQKIADSFKCPGVAVDLISCGKCGNRTVRVMIERRICGRKEDAERALTEGFVNLTKLTPLSKQRLRGVLVTHFVNPRARIGKVTLLPAKSTRNR